MSQERQEKVRTFGRAMWARCAVALVASGAGGLASAAALPDLTPFFDALRAGARMAQSTSEGNPEDEADLLRLVLQQAFEGYRIYFETDPDFPEWVEGNNYPRGNAGNSPDTRYFYTRLDPAGVYRIWGKRNSVAIVVLQVGRMGLQITDGKPLDHYSLDDLTLAADGSFEMILSGERPEAYKRDWRKLSPEAEVIYLRQVMLDWDREKDAEIYIERLDRPAVPPRLTTEALRARAEAMFRYTSDAVRVQMNPGVVVPRPPVNALQATTFSGTGGLAQQLYHWGRFDLSEDEALIVEAQAPSSCRFWNFQVTDTANVANDYMYRQTHLNKSILAIDQDDRFRLVVSQKDPGIANWIDTAGHRKGIMLMRWESCKEASEVGIKKVTLTEVRNYLPADTLLVTNAERLEALRKRTVALRRRLGR